MCDLNQNLLFGGIETKTTFCKLIADSLGMSAELVPKGVSPPESDVFSDQFAMRISRYFMQP